MPEMIPSSPVNNIRNLIYTIRGTQVMMDKDLAIMYGIETRVLNQAVKTKSSPLSSAFYVSADHAGI